VAFREAFVTATRRCITAPSTPTGKNELGPLGGNRRLREPRPHRRGGWLSRRRRTSPILEDMTIQRMDNVGIVVHDLDAAIAFFTELGMELEGRMPIEGSWAGNVVGLDDMRSEIAMMRIPGVPGRLELAKYHAPQAITPTPEITPANTLGLHRVMFAVDDIEDTLARLRPHGAQLVGEVTRFEDSYLLCYLRGPSGIILALAEQLN
jgi:catechol 2,3-dioxygenase-like lactoylglutathione lyase family enzyme